ncbi:MAG: sigma-70 family RNA polymerase sigma factor [Acidobacteriota bacterium]
MPHSTQVTQLLIRWSSGDSEALAKLMPLVCEQLRDLAGGYLRNEAAGHTLQPTALVNELYLRLHGCRTVNWKNRAHFFGFAAQTMRRVLVDHARGRKRAKRGRGERPVSIDGSFDLMQDPQSLDLIRLNDALEALETLDPRQAEIVNLRFFVGLTVEETAAVLDISAPTVKREWKLARLWLYREMRGPSTAK